MHIKPVKSFYYRVDEQTDEKKLFQSFNTDKNGVLRNNPKIKLYSGEWIKIKANDYITHIVKPAENINSIASKYNLLTTKILADNNLTDNKLFIGQLIKIYKS